ncbi:MAG: hypothetical protein ABIF87_01205 [Pseudomonadota bacterium]
MHTLTIQRKIEIPMMGTWKWKKDDYEIPLVFSLGGATAYLFLHRFDHGKREREILWEAILKIKISSPPQRLIKGLMSKSNLANDAAKRIYSYYQEVFNQFEAIVRTVGNVKSAWHGGRLPFDSFFKKGQLPFEKVIWWIDDEKPQVFTLPIKNDRRKIAPPFRREHLITREKWNKLQKAIDNRDFPSEEMIELLRIGSKLEWSQKKIATIESAIFIETILRDYGNQVLQSLGLSKTKLKSLNNEMSFNILLNIVLPLSLSKSELNKSDKYLQSVDLLRRIRNDVVHGNIKEKEIEEEKVRKGIDGALALVKLLQNKLKSSKP